MKYDKQKTGKRIKAARKAKGLSLRGLAALAKVSYKTIFSLEHGINPRYIESFTRIAETLDITTDWVLGGDSKDYTLQDIHNREKELVAREKELDKREKKLVDRDIMVKNIDECLCEGSKCPGYQALYHALGQEGVECAKCGISYTCEMVKSGGQSLCHKCAGIELTRLKIKVKRSLLPKNKGV